jgi:hypothetical protein
MCDAEALLGASADSKWSAGRSVRCRREARADGWSRLEEEATPTGAGSRLVAYAAGSRRLPPATDPGAPLTR